MNNINNAKSVASQLKGQLSSAKNTATKRSAAKKLNIEFREKKTDKLYSYLLFQKGNTYINLSVIVEDNKEKPILGVTSIQIVEDILDKLDKQEEYELINYGGMFDVEKTDNFDEKSLKFFVKEVKKQILNKMQEENETKSN